MDAFTLLVNNPSLSFDEVIAAMPATYDVSSQTEFVMCVITNLCCFPKGYSEENVGNLSQTIFANNGRDSFLSACFFLPHH